MDRHVVHLVCWFPWENSLTTFLQVLFSTVKVPVKAFGVYVEFTWTFVVLNPDHFCPLFQFLKPQKVDFVPKYKKKGRSKAGRVEKRKKGFQEFSKRAVVKELIAEKEKQIKERQSSKTSKGPGDVLDRFKKKTSWQWLTAKCKLWREL